MFFDPVQSESAAWAAQVGLMEVSALTAPQAAVSTATEAVGPEGTVAHHMVVAVRPDAAACAVEVRASIAAH